MTVSTSLDVAPVPPSSANVSASSATVSDGPLTLLVTSQTLPQSGASCADVVMLDELLAESMESPPMVEPPHLPLAPSPLETSQTGKPPWTRHLPAQFRDVLPEPPLPVEPNEPAPLTTLPRVILHVFDSICMSFNSFGIVHNYRHRPSYDLDAFLSIDQLSDNCDDEAPLPVPLTPHALPSLPWPWKNMSIWKLMNWMLTRSRQKSEAKITRLTNILQADNFNPHDLQGFNAHTQMKLFDNSESSLDENHLLQQDGWQETLVHIEVPTQECNPNGNGQCFTIGGLFHRPLTDVVHAVFTGKNAKLFQLTPFKWIWRSPVTGHEERIFDELYTSDAWNDAHDEIQKQQLGNGCKLERVITGLMFWSDVTHLTQFGSASAWPVYLFFGNQSKYMWACPTSGACHPVAFIPMASLISDDCG